MPSIREYDVNGWFEVSDRPLSLAGVFPYTAKSVQAPGWEAEPDRIIQVYRPEEELSDPETVASARLLPWTDDHEMLGDPDVAEGVTPPEDKGVHGTVGERVYYKDGALYGNIKLWSRNLSAAITSGKKELSCGFRCVYEFVHGDYRGQRYDAIQRRIRFNHLASVWAGRMGRRVSVEDGALYDWATFSFDASEAITMDKVKLRDRLSRLFGLDSACTAALLVGAAMDKDVEETKGDKAVTIDDVAAMISQLAPHLAKLGEIQSALASITAAQSGDMEPVLDAAGKPCMDAAGKPQMKKKATAGAGMDAADVRGQIAALDAKVSAIVVPTSQSIVKEIRTRDTLANRVAAFTGTFDHSEMTAGDVAKYACDKFGLKPAAGSEVAAVEAYLTNRAPAASGQAFGVAVAGADGAVKSPVADYLKTAAG